jgi:hypothetical protein
MSQVGPEVWPAPHRQGPTDRVPRANPPSRPLATAAASGARAAARRARWQAACPAHPLTQQYGLCLTWTRWRVSRCPLRPRGAAVHAHGWQPWRRSRHPRWPVGPHPGLLAVASQDAPRPHHRRRRTPRAAQRLAPTPQGPSSLLTRPREKPPDVTGPVQVTERPRCASSCGMDAASLGARAGARNWRSSDGCGVGKPPDPVGGSGGRWLARQRCHRRASRGGRCARSGQTGPAGAVGGPRAQG